MSPGALVATSTKQERWLFLMPKSELQICVALEQKGQACGASVPGLFRACLERRSLRAQFRAPFQVLSEEEAGWREGFTGRR